MISKIIILLIGIGALTYSIYKLLIKPFTAKNSHENPVCKTCPYKAQCTLNSKNCDKISKE